MSTQFPVTALDSYTTKASGDTISESHVNDLQDAVVALETKVGIDSSIVVTTLDYLVKGLISSGRKIWVYADTEAAGTGWTIYATAADCVIGVKGGTGSYNETGGTGTLYGNWTLSGATVAGHTHDAGTYALPNHTHTMATSGYGTKQAPDSAGAQVFVSGGMLVTGVAGAGSDLCSTATTGYQSASTLTGASASGTATLTNASWRPYAAVGIIIEKS